MINETKKGFSTAEATGGKRFTITDDALIMQRLSDDIYQNPVAAVIRELTTNAIDAQKDNGSTKKVEVHLPEIGAEYFSVTDSGLGMSKDTLLNIYTSYGSSNRRNSNDHIGGIGVGSKSPFAYCSQFTVKSVHDGKLIEAICQKDQQGVPSLYIVREEDTTEGSGTCVKISVGRHDHPKFRDNAREVLYWFRDQVSVNCRLENWLYTDTLFENENGIVTGGTINPRVLMGNILYSISPYKFAEYFQKCSILKMPIGSLGINISRESIQDNEINNATIKKAFDQFYSEAKAVILKNIEAIQCPKEKYYEAKRNSRVFGLSEEANTLNFVAYDTAAFQVYADPEEYLQKNLSSKVSISKMISEGVVYQDLNTGFKSALKRFSRKCVVTGDIKKFLKQFAFIGHNVTTLSEAKKDFAKSSGSKCFYKFERASKRFISSSGMSIDEVKKEVAQQKADGKISVIVPLNYKDSGSFEVIGYGLRNQYLSELPENVCLYSATNAVAKGAILKVNNLISIGSYIESTYFNTKTVQDRVMGSLLRDLAISIDRHINNKISLFDYYQKDLKELYRKLAVGEDLLNRINALHREAATLNNTKTGHIEQAAFEELIRRGSASISVDSPYYQYVGLEAEVEKKMGHPFFELAFPKIDESYYERCWQKAEEMLNAQVSE